MKTLARISLEKEGSPICVIELKILATAKLMITTSGAVVKRLLPRKAEFACL